MISLVTPQSMGHNPYFNRWFSAIESNQQELHRGDGHNPYFNRWFSAILIDGYGKKP